MRKRALFVCVLLITVFRLSAIEVDEEEITSEVSDVIAFQNYTGPVVRFETDRDIRGIGMALSAELPVPTEEAIVPGSAVFAGKYRVTRIPPDPLAAMRGADIIEFLPDAAVDHIDNVRRIIAGYLEGAFGYSRGDAQTLSFFITIYNAIHRGAVEVFAQRYSSEVIAYLDPQRAGLALSFSEWPGRSQIVIPLTSSAAMNALSSVAADEIAEPAVIDTVRDTDDSGIEERQAVVELMDRAVEEERDQIRTEEQTVTALRRDVESEQQRIDEQIRVEQENLARVQASQESAEETTETTTDTPQSAERAREAEAIQQRIETLETERETVEEEARAVDEQEQELEVRTASADAVQQRADEIREETATDLREQLPESPPVPVPVVYASSRIENGLVLSNFRVINGYDAETLTQGPEIDFVGRDLIAFGQALAGIGYDGDGEQGRIVLLDPESLEILAQSDEPVFVQSRLLPDPRRGVLYAVVFVDGDWHIGQFDSGLNLVLASSAPIVPYTDIRMTDTVILVSRKPDERVIRLSRDTMRID